MHHILPAHAHLISLLPQHPKQAHCAQERPWRIHQGRRCQPALPGCCKTKSVPPRLLCISAFPGYLLTPFCTVTKLNDVRDDTTAYNNRVDTTLADVFSLLSLFYLTIGKTRDAPAAYCQIASMRVSVYIFPLTRRASFHVERGFPRV
jgi:hypothetical protein